MDLNLIAERTGRPEFAAQWLAQALEAGKMGAWLWDLHSGTVHFDATQVALTGLGDATGALRATEFFAIIDPEDVESVQKAVEQSIADNSSYIHEFRIKRPNGDLVWLGARGRVVCDDAGIPTHLTGLNWDISDAKRREEQSILTAKEMAHRVKNVIALVQGIARMSAANHDSLDTFLPAFMERTRAIATVNNLILSTEKDRVSLHNIVSDTLHSVNANGRIKVSVADFEVNAPAAQTLVLVLNELATNAIKYGALQHPDGQIDLNITVDHTSDQFVLEWIEQRAEPIEQNKEGYLGFGSQVLMTLTKATYRGDPSYEWRSHGLRYSCTWKASEMSITYGAPT